MPNEPTLRCQECGAMRGVWHAETCMWRLHAMPADENICRHIGDAEKHGEVFKEELEWLQQRYMGGTPNVR